MNGAKGSWDETRRFLFQEPILQIFLQEQEAISKQFTSLHGWQVQVSEKLTRLQVLSRPRKAVPFLIDNLQV
jgi:hypothetical protein